MARILIIDDNDHLRNVLKESMLRVGHEVLTAPNGGAGLDLVMEKRPDLVITDIIMPGKDGGDVVFEMKENFPNIKMIVMTGGGQRDAKDYLNSIMKHSDVKYAFEKPFSLEEMLHVVKDLVG